jgi:putative transcriptional regulator
MAFSDSALSQYEPSFFEHEGWLEGQLLVATPLVKGDIFSQSVIYLFAHNEKGAMGVIINKPMEIAHYASLFRQISVNVTGHIDDLVVYHGGPVEEHRGFVVHSPDYVQADTITSDSGICVTANANVLRDIAAGAGPRNRVMMIGYAGWEAGQLEAEIESNSWITVPATPELVFHTPDEVKWDMTAKSLGVDMVRYSFAAGHA